MDPFDGVLGRMRTGGSRTAHFRLAAPWSVRFSTKAEAWLVVVTRGQGWLRWSGAPAPVRLDTGACVIVQPGVVFDVSDAPRRAATSCESLAPVRDGYIVEYGGDGELTEVIAGRFAFDPVAAEPLVTMMPPLVHVPLGVDQVGLMRATLALMGEETARDGLGAAFVLDRLTDVLFVQAMRAMFTHGCDASPAFLETPTDRRIAKAIRAVHADLARPWTVEAMAREAGVSRSSFASAFASAVGESPLDYVTNWRVYRAKVLLSSSDASVAEVAARVGYESDTALSRAFKRKVGVAPGAFRRQLRSA